MNSAPLSGGVVVDALQTFDQLGNPAVSMQMDSRGARIWENMTGKAFKEASNIAIVLDNIVYSAPGVSMELSAVDVLKLQETLL